MTRTVQRWDAVTLPGSSFERTPQGGIRARARFTRTGVLEYDLPDGSKRREYRPPEEVFAPASIASLNDAPITIHHPDDGEVKPGTYSKLTVGHVRNDVAVEDDRYLAGTVVIQDESAVRMTLNGSLQEFSAGYTSTLDMTPGVSPDGERYDCVQRGITYNHAAFLPPGLGRAGPEVSLRLDSNGHQIEPTTHKDQTMELTPEEIEELRPLIQAVPRLMALVAAPAPAPAEMAPPAAAPPAAPEQMEDAETAPAAAPAPAPMEEEKKLDSKELERIINDAAELRVAAAKVLGDQYSFAGKGSRDVMLDVIRHVDSKAADLSSRSDDYVRGAFDQALTRHAERRTDSLEQHFALRAPRNDSAGPTDYSTTLDKRIAAASRRN